jgi:hypothetical protein
MRAICPAHLILSSQYGKEYRPEENFLQQIGVALTLQTFTRDAQSSNSVQGYCVILRYFFVFSFYARNFEIIS